MSEHTNYEEMDRMAKGWSIAMEYSEARLRNVYELDDDEMKKVIQEGTLVLETVCLVVHCNIKGGQFRPPLDFWKMLLTEYGIMVYPSALTEKVDLDGLGKDATFLDIYRGHIVMLGKPSPCPPQCPFEYLREPPPVYEK